MRAAVCALTGMVGAALCAPVDGDHPLACRLAPDRRSAHAGNLVRPRAEELVLLGATALLTGRGA